MVKATKNVTANDEQNSTPKVSKVSKSTKTNTKTTESVSTETTTTEPVVQNASTESPVVTEGEKVKKTRAVKKTKEFVTTTETPATETTEVANTENVVVEQENDEIVSLSNDFTNKLNTVFSSLSALRADFKNLERKYMKELKASQKLNIRKKRKANRAPSGFVKPTKISAELATFLGKPLGFEMARTEVTREINKYIRQHNLQDSVNGRKINPNPALAKLLKLNPTDQLTYFNLQRYMSPHFQKLTPVVVTETATATA